MNSVLNFALEVMVLENISNEVCFDCLGLFPIFISKLQPDVEADGQFHVATAIENSDSGNIFCVRYLFSDKVGNDLFPYLVVQSVDKVAGEVAS